MFHRPVEEVWQGLHMQITFRVQSREVHRREKVKPLHVPTKEKRLQAMRSGATQPALEERCVLSPATAFQQTAKDKGEEGSSTSCTLVQSVRLWASWGHKHWAKSRGPWQLSTLAGRGLATSHPAKSLEGERGRRREREII